MKKFSLVTLIAVMTLGFSSCSVEDETAILTEPTAEELLKSFNFSRSAQGDFSVDYKLRQGGSSDNVVDNKTNTNNIYLYSSGGRSKSDFNQGLDIQNGRLRVNFNDTEKEENISITVLDDEIKTRSEDNEYLTEYGISGNEDGSYVLNFSVRDGVAANVVYNDDTSVYEVHLNQNNNASQSEFLETFNKGEDDALKIVFKNDTQNRTSSHPGKPVIIIDNGEGGD